MRTRKPQEVTPHRLRRATNLTARESEVLQLLAQGLTSAQIAQQLIITPFTVNAHIRSIYGKLGINTRSAATRYVFEQHLF